MNKFERDLIKSMGEALDHTQGKRKGAGRAVALSRPHHKTVQKMHGIHLRMGRHCGTHIPTQRHIQARVHVVEVPNVRAIRRKLRMSQAEFAEKYKIPVSTLKNWEQGRRQPDAPASAYLLAIAMRPREISEALEI